MRAAGQKVHPLETIGSWGGATVLPPSFGLPRPISEQWRGLEKMGLGAAWSALTTRSRRKVVVVEVVVVVRERGRPFLLRSEEDSRQVAVENCQVAIGRTIRLQ